MSKIKCEHCGRRIPVVDGKLVKHWVGSWFDKKFCLVGDRVCMRSGMTAEHMQEIREAKRHVY